MNKVHRFALLFVGVTVASAVTESSFTAGWPVEALYALALGLPLLVVGVLWLNHRLYGRWLRRTWDRHRRSGGLVRRRQAVQ